MKGGLAGRLDRDVDASRRLIDLTETELASLIRAAVADALAQAPHNTEGVRPKTLGIAKSNLTIRETSELLRVCEKTVQCLVRNRTLKAVKLGTAKSARVLIPRAAIERYLAESVR